MGKRVTELDGVRGLAIALVLVWHYGVCQLKAPPGSVGESILRLLSMTWSGVDLFFVLSGFLIVGILLDVKGSPTYFKTFYLRRACRILPLYVLLLATFVYLPRAGVENPWLFEGTIPLWSYATFTQNLQMLGGLGPNWVAVTWSLAIEEQFYILIPMVVAALPRRRLCGLFVALIVLSPVLRWVIGGLGAFVLPFARADSILLGGLLAAVIRNPEGLGRLERYRGASKVAAALLGCGFVVLSFTSNHIGGVLNHLCLALFYGTLVVVVLVDTECLFSRVMRSRVLVWLGLRSYAIYLLHQGLSGLVHQRLNGSPFPFIDGPRGLAVTLLALAATFAVAELSFRFFETPILAYGRRSSY
jgi:peptidoglycan/LPS O-acetylase OafA/YrhL